MPQNVSVSRPFCQLLIVFCEDMTTSDESRKKKNPLFAKKTQAKKHYLKKIVFKFTYIMITL